MHQKWFENNFYSDHLDTDVMLAEVSGCGSVLSWEAEEVSEFSSTSSDRFERDVPTDISKSGLDNAYNQATCLYKNKTKIKI